MANITLTNQTNSPIKIDTTYFWVNTPTTADLTGLDLQIAEIYRDSGLGTLVTASAPENTSLPTVSGDATVGAILSATDGAWSGAPAPTFEYQWQRSADGASGWSDISGATGDTYTLVGGDEGQYVRIQVTATNAVGSDTAASLASEMVVSE